MQFENKHLLVLFYFYFSFCLIYFLSCFSCYGENTRISKTEIKTRAKEGVEESKKQEKNSTKVTTPYYYNDFLTRTFSICLALQKICLDEVKDDFSAHPG